MHTKMAVTMTIPKFKTPQALEKFPGFFIEFCRGRIKEIPSKAYTTVPKKRGS
jgi:hypothetical protein